MGFEIRIRGFYLRYTFETMLKGVIENRPEELQNSIEVSKLPTLNGIQSFVEVRQSTYHCKSKQF